MPHVLLLFMILQIEELNIKHHLSVMRTRETKLLNSLAPDTSDLQNIKSMVSITLQKEHYDGW